MTVSEELAEERIEKFNRSITRSAWKLENQDLSEESLSRVHNSIGRDEQSIGLYKLLVGDVAAAMEQFEEATRRYLLKYEHKKKAESEENNTYWHPQMSTLEQLLYGALLTRNERLVNEAAEHVRELDDSYVHKFPKTAHRYFHVKALAAVATDAEVQKEYVEEFKESFSEEKPSHQRYFGAIANVLEGIVERDEELLRDGLQVLIDHYDEDTNDDPEGLSDWVSKRVTAFVMLAQQRGIDLDIESRYIPDCILSNTDVGE